MLIVSIFNLIVVIGVFGCFVKYLKVICMFEIWKKEFLFVCNRFFMIEKGDINEI